MLSALLPDSPGSPINKLQNEWKFTKEQLSKEEEKLSEISQKLKESEDNYSKISSELDSEKSKAASLESELSSEKSKSEELKSDLDSKSEELKKIYATNEQYEKQIQTFANAASVFTTAGKLLPTPSKSENKNAEEVVITDSASLNKKYNFKVIDYM